MHIAYDNQDNNIHNCVHFDQDSNDPWSPCNCYLATKMISSSWWTAYHCPLMFPFSAILWSSTSVQGWFVILAILIIVVINIMVIVVINIMVSAFFIIMSLFCQNSGSWALICLLQHGQFSPTFVFFQIILLGQSDAKRMFFLQIIHYLGRCLARGKADSSVQ